VPNIRPGLSAKAEIVVAERKNSLAVPLGAVTVRDLPLKEDDIRRYKGKLSETQEATLSSYGFQPKPEEGGEVDDDEINREETEGVFLIVDGFVKYVPVKIGIAGEDDFEILDGLTEGQVIVKGPFRILRELKEGAMVTLEGEDKKKFSFGASDK